MANNKGTTENDPMLDVHTQVGNILKDDYVKFVKDLSGKELTWFDFSTGLSVTSGIFTGLASVLAFAAGFFNDQYLSFAAGCCGILSLIFYKGALYAYRQSQHKDLKLRSVLTSNYQFLNQFMNKPLSLQIEKNPEPPDMDLYNGTTVSKGSNQTTKDLGNIDLESGLHQPVQSASNKDKPTSNVSNEKPNVTVTLTDVEKTTEHLLISL
jgi:hypothetical protein